MKERKGILKWSLLAAGLALLILLLVVFITACGQTEQTLPVPTTEDPAPTQTVAETEQTEETEETTEPETTAPTEETTEPTEAEEETTATTESDSDTDSSDTKKEEEDFGDEEPYWEGPDPGTPKNPYLEVLGEYPAEVESVKIPIDAKVSYVISGSAGSVITIRDPAVTLTLDGKTYKADEATGEVTVDLSKLGVDPVITLAHSGKTASACVLNLTEGLGGAGNPEPLTDPAELLIQLPAGDSNGYHYQWISQITGQVELTLKAKEVPTEEAGASEEASEKAPAEEPALEIIVTIGEQTLKLSECENDKLVFDTVKGQEILIQVIAKPFANGTYPAIEETAIWKMLPAPGTQENPLVIETIETVTVALEAGNAEGYYYQWTAPTYANVTQKAPDLNLFVTVEETRYESEQGEVTFHVDKDQTVLLQVTEAAAPEDGTQTVAINAATISGTILPDAGTPENPVVQENIESITAALQQGDRDGYTVQWTAPYSGTLELTAETADAGFDVILSNKNNGETQKLSDAAEGKLSMKLEAADAVTVQTIAVPDENGQYNAVEGVLKSTFTEEPGSSPENPIVITQTDAPATYTMEAKQTLYFSGAVREMIATLDNAHGASIHYGEETVWANQSGAAQMEFPAAQTEEPVAFSVTSRTEKTVTLSFAYPVGHEKNPAVLPLGQTNVSVKENNEGGYHLEWTADCDGQLTVAVQGQSGWQYQLDDLTAGTSGERYTSTQDPVTASQTVEVTKGTKVRLTLWTLAAEEGARLPAGQLRVEASFFDPLLGTEAKPIALVTGEKAVNTVKIPAGGKLYYTAEAEGMILHLAGQNVTLTHDGTDYVPENGSVELLCHGVDSVFVIEGNPEKEQICTLHFTYPVGHRENPAELVMGENTAVLEDGSLCGYTFVWTAEGTGILTVTMTEETGWQYLITNETSGVAGEIHTCEDDPVMLSQEIEVTKGDRVFVIVNTFDQEHPLDAPAGKLSFTAEFVDPTLGMEENPIWLNPEDTLEIPEGKAMYCAAKADGMILTLKGEHVVVTHNGTEYPLEKGEVNVLCAGTGTFGHPVFAVTNTGTGAAICTVSFAYPVGHFQNPAELKLEEMSVVPGKSGQYFLWTAQKDGVFTFTVNTEDGWKYMITNVTTGKAGEIRSADDAEPIISESLEVKAGHQLRILVNAIDAQSDTPVTFTAAFVPAQTEPAEE